MLHDLKSINGYRRPSQRYLSPQHPTMRYITVNELAEIIKSDKKPMKDYLVVDVRDDDYRGGNVKGCLNVPSEKFSQKLDDLLEQTKDIPIIIFHCALSQQRYASARVFCMDP